MNLPSTNVALPTTGLKSSQPASKTQLPPAALESLAGRFRLAGLFVICLGNDGTLSFYDHGAAPLFLRYVHRGWQLADGAALGVARRPELLAVGPAGQVVHLMPGVNAAVLPCTDRKHHHGVLMLACRSEDFSLTEDVLRLCGRLELDQAWVEQQARSLPAYGNDALLHQAKMLLEMLRDSTRTVGLEKEVDSLSGQLADTYEELSLIYQISSGMKVNRRASDFFRQACLEVLQVMNVRGMGVALDCEVGSRVEPAVYGSVNLPPDAVRRLHAQLTADSRDRKAALQVNDLKSHSVFRWLGDYANRLLAVPLQRQEQVLGCMFALDHLDGDEFDSVDSKLLTSIANEAAIYLENAMLFEDVHGLMMGLLHSLTSAVDAKDAYTCGHSERVALVSRYLAQQMGLSDRDVEQVYMAGLLHDVGKIGVPEAVLQKAGRLTNEEFELIKKHPAIGARILQDVKQIREIVPGVLHHHERYDGKGYPGGLAGKDIPLLGRIICLADCFDAMTSSRTYRKALPLEVALAEIRRCSGTHFDPGLAETFLRTGPEGFRELLRDHRSKAKKLREVPDGSRSI